MAETLAELDTKTQVTGQVAPQYSAEHSQTVSLQNRDDPEKSAPNSPLVHEHEYPTGITRVFILGPVTLAYFLFFLDLAVLSTATPAITSEFNSLVDIGWYVYERNFNSSCLTDRRMLGTVGRTSSAAQRSSP